VVDSVSSWLMANGLEEAAQREYMLDGLREMGLTPQEKLVSVLVQGSVSGLVEVEELYRFVTEDMSEADKLRFHNAV